MLLKPIVECAGTDISHWFNPETGEVRTHIDPVTGCVVAYTPKGRFLHIPPPVPRTDWSSDVGTPWWKDMEYCIGNLTSKTRALRVVNILSSQEQLIEVCTEESMNEIQKRYMTYNTNSRLASKPQCYNSDCGRRAEHPGPFSNKKRAEEHEREERTMRSWPSSCRLSVAKCRRKKSLQTCILC